MTVMQTDRRLRAALLPYQPRLLSEVLDALDTAVVVLDLESRVLAGNVAASRLLGIRRGRRAADSADGAVVSITDENGLDVDATNYDFWLARSGERPLMLRVGYEDGSSRWFRATSLAVGADAPDAVVCRYVDVTARRDLERRAAAAADHAARVEIDLVAAEQRIALLEELLVYLTTRSTG